MLLYYSNNLTKPYIKKSLLLISVLALGLIFTACQNQETKPITKTVPAVTTETPTITEANNTKALESSAFSITVPANLTVEASENYARIQNYTPNNDLYTLKDGEYYIEFVLYNRDNEEENFGFANGFYDSYKKTEKIKFNGKNTLYGTDREISGDGTPGVGYLIKGTKGIEISISADKESGITAAKELLKNLTLK